MVLPSVDDTPLCRRKKKSSQSSRRGRRRRWQQVLFLILSDNEGGDSHQIESALFFQVLFGQVLSSHCHFVRKLFTFSLELKKKEPKTDALLVRSAREVQEEWWGHPLSTKPESRMWESRASTPEGLSCERVFLPVCVCDSSSFLLPLLS